MTSPVPDEDVRLLGRNGEIWRRYVNGETQPKLAREYGISQQRVSQIIDAVRNDIPERVREDLITREVELLDRLRSEVLNLWDRAPDPVLNRGGEVVFDPDSGEALRDHTGRLRALETVLKVHERTARLLGLDAASKVEATINTEETSAATIAAAEAARRLAGGTP